MHMLCLANVYRVCALIKEPSMASPLTREKEPRPGCPASAGARDLNKLVCKPSLLIQQVKIKRRALLIRALDEGERTAILKHRPLLRVFLGKELRLSIYITNCTMAENKRMPVRRRTDLILASNRGRSAALLHSFKPTLAPRARCTIRLVNGLQEYI